MRRELPLQPAGSPRATVPAYWRASHPEPAVAVTLVTAALAAAAGRDRRGSAGIAAAVFCGQLSEGWLNDALDADRDRAAGRGDKPVAAGEVPRDGVLAAAAGSGVLALALTLPSGPRATAAHAVALGAAYAYDARLKATLASVAPFALAFGLLPSIVTLGLPDAPLAPAWATAAGALLGGGAHLANALPDLEDDLATGVRGLPHALGAGPSRALAAGLLLAASGVLVAGPPGPPGRLPLAGLAAATGLVTAGLVRGRRPGSRAAFRATLAVAVLDVALLVGQGSALR
jgi:4-hydroxybenzoate polyprenyltransferase